MSIVPVAWTSPFGHLSTYAMSVDGDALTIDHMAADIAEEIARRKGLR
jgi:hypothetical protein